MTDLSDNSHDKSSTPEVILLESHDFVIELRIVHKPFKMIPALFWQLDDSYDHLIIQNKFHRFWNLNIMTPQVVISALLNNILPDLI